MSRALAALRPPPGPQLYRNVKRHRGDVASGRAPCVLASRFRAASRGRSTALERCV
jgi:hypothetical protein